MRPCKHPHQSYFHALCTKQPGILTKQAALDWAIELLSGSHHPPLLGKVKTAVQISNHSFEKNLLNDLKKIKALSWYVFEAKTHSFQYL